MKTGEKIARYFLEVLVDVAVGIITNSIDLGKAIKEETIPQGFFFIWFFAKDTKHVHSDWVLPAMFLILMALVSACIGVVGFLRRPSLNRFVKGIGAGMIAFTSIITTLVMQSITGKWHPWPFVGIIVTAVTLIMSARNLWPRLQRKIKMLAKEKNS